MAKPCRDCYQTVNIYGHPLAWADNSLSGVSDHVLDEKMWAAHNTCAPGFGCSGHSPLSEFESFVREVLCLNS